MKLIIPILLNCLMVLGVYLAEKHSIFKKWTYWTKQIVIGVIFAYIILMQKSLNMIVNITVCGHRTTRHLQLIANLKKAI